MLPLVLCWDRPRAALYKRNVTMQVSITFRHMEATDALRSYIDDKISSVEKFLIKPTAVHVILSVQGINQRAEIVLLEQNFKASADESTADMYKAIDLAIEKIESQVKRHKDKLQDHHKKGRVSLHDVAIKSEQRPKIPEQA